MRAHNLVVTKDYGTGEAIIQARVVKDDVKHVLELFDDLRDKEIDIEIKRHRSKRSLDANAYAWVLINKIAEKVRLSPVEVYCQLIREIGGNREIVPVRNDAAETWRRNWESRGIGWICEVLSESKLPGYTNMACFYGSSAYDTAQMSALIDSAIEDAKELGIEYLPPREIERMLSKWR